MTFSSFLEINQLMCLKQIVKKNHEALSVYLHMCLKLIKGDNNMKNAHNKSM